MTATRELPTGARSILCAATELFAQEGFESVSVGAIAERAGVSKANVFHHFSSKEALILAVMREISLPHAQFAEALLAETDTCADKLRRLIAFEIIDMFENRQQMQLVLREIVDHSREEVRALAQQVFYRNFRATVALFEQGQQSGEFCRDFDPAVAAMILGGANHLFFHYSEILRGLAETKRIKTAENFASQIFRILLNGIVAPAAAEPAHSTPQAHAVRKHAVRKHAVRKHKVLP
jgi:TetR/AcrR family transcriptional regulator